MTDNGERKQERLEEVPLETTAREVQEHAKPAEPDEIVAGNPAAAEAVTTSLQLEGLPEPDNGSKSIVEELEHPITLLPAPFNLDAHPADSLQPPDSPTTSLINSLRSQLTLLSEQSHQLNTKLVASISRTADLEDQHYDLQSEHKTLEGRARELEKSKKQWEESMSTGLLVERSQIRDEMQKLAAGLVEEERRRGSAEERRWKLEGEVDALTATLFDQANTMVAAERMGRVQAEERLQNAEDNLVAAEAAVRDMQLHLQSLPTTAVPSNESPHSSAPPPSSRRYLSSHVPYAEYITFLHHLRALRPLKGKSKDMLPAPIITILLAQPFLARAVTEDHDSTLRLDAAPDLSWLTRKGVSQAIIAGDLIIEPVSASTIITHSSSSIESIGCSLCGKPVFPPTLPQSPGGSPFGPPPSHPAQRTTSSSRFSLKPFFKASPSQAISSPTQSPLASPGPGQSSSHSALSSVYIFRIAATQASDKEPRAYPLCKTGWCLERLRATCDLWHFVRTGIIHVVWSADDGYVLASESTQVTPRGNGELERPQEVVRLKSEWGLGFKLAEKTGSGGGGWGKGWTRSNPGSPGVERGKELGEVEEVGEKKEGLGAPLELEASAAEGQIGERNTSEGQNAEEVKEVSKEESKSTVDGEDKVDGEVPTIHETNPSPSVPMSETVRSELPTENASAEETSLQAPKLHRADSTPSVNGTDDGASFSTPNNTALELPDENGGFNIATDVVDLSSPSTESRSIPPSPGKDGKMPPPIPKRAAGRKRPKQLEVGGSSRSSLERVEGESERKFTPIEGISGDEETKIELVGERANGTEGPSETETEGSRRPSLPPRPTLPPRHPKTPISHVPELASEGQKTFSGGDGWEVRTWKQVIRLKEEMWRARVGVLDN